MERLQVLAPVGQRGVAIDGLPQANDGVEVLRTGLANGVFGHRTCLVHSNVFTCRAARQFRG